MSSFTDKALKDVYKDLLHTDNSNTGISSALKQITCGDGDTSALYLSTRGVNIRPSSDTTGTAGIMDSDGNILFAVDTTNDLVKAGVGLHTVNTQYVHFGISSIMTTISEDTHTAIPFGTMSLPATLLELGSGTNPATSHTVSTTGYQIPTSTWYVMDNITIDRIIWWVGADADNASGDVAMRAHLMQYDIVAGTGSTSGDLSNGTVLADGADISNAGYEQAYYQQLSISSANVDAGKALVFAFRYDSTTATDYSISATIKYHLR